MTQDEIMKMAEQAGMFTHKEVQPEIQAFAKLVAAKEREACAMVSETKGFFWKARHDINPDDAEKAYMASQFIASAIRARDKS